MRKKIKKNIFLSIRIIATFAIFLAIFKFIPYKKLIEIYKDSQKHYLFLSVFISFFALIIAAFRWRFFLFSLGVKISFREAVCSYFSGLFLNLFFPSYIAGDVFRGFSISYRHGNLKQVASSVLMDRFTGITALTLLSLGCFIFYRKIITDQSVVVTLFVLCFLVSFAFLVIFSKSFFLFLMRIFKKKSVLKERIVSFHDQLYFFRENPFIFLKALLPSFLIHMIISSGFFIAALAFDVNLSIFYFFMLVPIVIAIASMPLTIAGAGTREAAAVYFFSLIGIDKSVGLGIALLNLIFMVLAGIIGGIIYVSVYHRRLQPHS